MGLIILHGFSRKKEKNYPDLRYILISYTSLSIVILKCFMFTQQMCSLWLHWSEKWVNNNGACILQTVKLQTSEAVSLSLLLRTFHSWEHPWVPVAFSLLPEQILKPCFHGNSQDHQGSLAEGLIPSSEIGLSRANHFLLPRFWGEDGNSQRSWWQTTLALARLRWGRHRALSIVQKCWALLPPHWEEPFSWA